jgi:ethanolamine utilization cobalamin adenosyltransferase
MQAATPPGNGAKQEKPEHLTALREGVLVPKTHSRICLRGKLDSLEALTLQTQLLALREGDDGAAQRLEKLYGFMQQVMRAEVKDEALQPIALWGMSSARLRYVSQHVKECFGLDGHPVPHAGMGALCLALNYLRTQVREAELAAAAAFIQDGNAQRPDLLEALNRMSSAVYLLFLSVLTGKEVSGT